LDFASGVLRLAGEVVDGPEEVAKGSAQSLTIEKGTKLEITKERWKKHQIDRMNKAKRKLASAVLVCALDDGEVAFAGVSDSGVRELGELTLSLASKCSMRDCKSPKGQYEDLAKALRNFFDQLAPKGVVVASPGFWKDELFKVLKTKDSDLARTVRVESISTGGLAGVKELVKKGLDSESLAEEEAGLMEEIQKRIAKNGAVAYGLNDVKKSVAAVEKLAVSEKYVAKERKAGNYSAVEKLVDAVEKAGGTVILVGKSDAGKLLDGIGGIAALLHYKVK
jgi:protein pelota